MSFNLNNLDEENYNSDNEEEEKKEIEDNLISAKSKKYKLQEKKKEEKKIVESTPLNISDKKKDDLFDDEINTINDENYLIIIKIIKIINNKMDTQLFQILKTTLLFLKTQILFTHQI
jgi:hypothetical protein